MHPFSSYLHQVHEWPSLHNHEAINGGDQQNLKLIYDLNQYRVQNEKPQYNPTMPIYNDQVYTYPDTPDVLELSGDLYPQSHNSIFNYFELLTRQRRKIGDTGLGRSAIFSAPPNPAVDHSIVEVETLDQWGKDIAVPFWSSHLPISPPPSTTTTTLNQAVSSKSHNLLELRTASSESFPTQLIQGISSHQYRCKLARCTCPHKTFSSAEAVIEHIRTEDIPQRDRHAVWCSCNKWFASRNNGKRHVITENAGKQYGCSECPQRFKRKDQIKTHLSAKHGILI